MCMPPKWMLSLLVCFCFLDCLLRFALRIRALPLISPLKENALPLHHRFHISITCVQRKAATLEYRLQSDWLCFDVLYNLDSTYPDSSFYRLVRHFLSDQIHQWVIWSDWIVHFIWLVRLLVLELRGIYFPGCTVLGTWRTSDWKCSITWGVKLPRPDARGPPKGPRAEVLYVTSNTILYQQP